MLEAVGSSGGDKALKSALKDCLTWHTRLLCIRSWISVPFDMMATVNSY